MAETKVSVSFHIVGQSRQLFAVLRNNVVFLRCFLSQQVLAVNLPFSVMKLKIL